MTKDDTYKLDQIAADGGSEKAAPEQVSAVKSHLDRIRNDLSDNVFSERERLGQVRFCQWPGQSEDGRKHDGAKRALPFDGASDTRPFMADGIINFIVAELSTAASRATARDTGMESTDSQGGGFNSTLIKWLVMNQWTDYRKQIELAVQYAYGDSPGACVFWTDWCEDKEVSLQKLTIDELAAQIGAQMNPDAPEEEQLNTLDMLFDPSRAEDLKAALAAYYPNLSTGRIAKVVRSIYKGEDAEFPVPRVKSAIPKMRALRLFKDIFFDRSVEDIQKAPVVALANYYSEAGVREQAAKYGWNKKFVDGLLASGKGRSAFNDSALTSAVAAISTQAEPDNELFEVLTVYTRAVNEDGIPGVYWQTISYFVKDPATDRNLFDRSHGEYPFDYYSRESLTACLVDSRGVAEIVQTDQNSVKLLDDSFEDHTQQATNPVRKIPKGYPAGTFRWGPLAEMEIGPRDATNVGYIDPPAYPQANKDHYLRMRTKVSQYWGIPFEDVNERFLVMYSQQRVDGLLHVLRQVFVRAVQLMDQFMEPEQIARITGQSVQSLNQNRRQRSEIQGKYDLSLTFDVRDLDMEFLIKKVDTALKIRQLDPSQRINIGAIAVNAIASLDPNWAQDAVRSEAQANSAEEQAAKTDLVKMLNGVQVPLQDDPWSIDPAVRKQTIEQELLLRQQNPQAFPPVSQAAAALIGDYLKNLEQMGSQQQNAITGRTGVEPTDLAALGQEKSMGVSEFGGVGVPDNQQPATNNLPAGGGQ
jgi:hypothetical protein